MVWEKEKARILIREPFLASLLLSLEIKNSESVATAATDGKVIFINPKWFGGLTMQERIGVLLHELLHIAMLHHTRRRGRDAATWNVAADYAINYLIIDNGYNLPEGALIYNRFNGLSAEEIYEKIKNEKNEMPSWGMVLDFPGGDSGDEGNAGDSNDNNGDNGECGGGKGVKDEEKRVKKILSGASTIGGRLAGSLGGALKKFVEKEIYITKDWKRLLSRFVEDAFVKKDFDWNTPSRRWYSNGSYYYPGFKKDDKLNIAVVIDTSGSTYEDLVDKFVSELNALLAQFDSFEITLIQCDYEIQKVDNYTDIDLPLKVEIKGGGGTSFVPAFEYIKNLDVKAVIYLTDGQGEFPSEDPGIPVFWAGVEEFKPPFGIFTKIE